MGLFNVAVAVCILCALFVISFMCLFYVVHHVNDNAIQTENEISDIINNNTNMTPIQKVTLISSMCSNGGKNIWMENKCKEKLYLKHIE